MFIIDLMIIHRVYYISVSLLSDSDWKPMSSDDDHQLIVQIIYVQYMGIKSTERDYIPLSINSSEIQIIITTVASYNISGSVVVLIISKFMIDFINRYVNI